MNIPSAQSVRRLDAVLAYVRTGPIPARADWRFLRQGGFTASSDSQYSRILELLGFVDRERVPTERWRRFRAQPQTELKAAVATTYARLLTACPQVQTGVVDRAAVDWFGSTLTQGPATARQSAIRTFRYLYTQATRPASPGRPSSDIAVAPATAGMGPAANDSKCRAKPPVLIQLPVGGGREAYIPIFQAIRDVFYP